MNLNINLDISIFYKSLKTNYISMNGWQFVSAIGFVLVGWQIGFKVG